MPPLLLTFFGSFVPRRRIGRQPLFAGLLLFAFGVLYPAPLRSQTSVDGALRGRIVTAQGAPLPGATLHLTRDDSSWQQLVPVARDGSFIVLDLSPAGYTLRAGLLGVPLPCAVAHLTVEPGEIAEVSLITELRGATHCAPNAASLPPAFEPLSANSPLQSFDSLDEDALAELDSSAHNATLASASATDTSEDDPAAPAVEREASELGAAASGPSLNGLSPMQNSELLDGLSTTQNFRSGPRGAAAGGPRTAATFGQGAVRSFRVMPHTFSARYGSAAGGVIAVASRGQAEHLHGSAFVRTRQSALAATNPFSVVTHYQDGVIRSSLFKPDDRLFQLGGTAGLPLSRLPLRWLQHASFFGSLQGQLRYGQIVSSPATAAFYALTPEQLALLDNRGVSAGAANTALDYLDSLTGAQDRTSTRTLGFARLDLVPALHQQLTFGYIGSRFNSPTGSSRGASEGVVPRGRNSLADSVVHVDAFTGHWLYRLSPRSTNELRGQIARDFEFETPHTPLPQEPAIGPGGFAPQVSISPNGFSYGTAANFGRTAYPDEHRLQLADDWTLVHGRHLFTLGADWSRVHDRIGAAANPEGTFLYDSGTTNGRDGGLVDWITDYTFNVHAYPNGACPSINATVHLFCFRSYTQGFSAAQTQFVTHELAGFAEDALRLPHGVALTLGARYDYTLLPPPQTPNPALDQVISSIAGPLSGATAVIPEDRNNLGPRIALTWSPANGRWLTVRLGYGVFFGRVPGATVREALADTALPSTTRRIRITPSTTTACPQVANQGFGYPCAYISEPPSTVAQTTSAVLFAHTFRLPSVQRATLAIERNGRHFDLHVAYAMSIATQLPQSVDLNIAPATATTTFMIQGGDGYPGLHTGQTFSLALYTARRSTAFGPISALVSNANATYHALTVESRVRAGDVQLHGSYTFARAIDYGPQLSATPRIDGQFDPFTDGYDKGLSSLDRRYRFTGDLLLRSSLRRGPEHLRRTLSGWRLVTTASLGSGAPYSYAVFGGTELSGGRESLNGSGGAAYLPTVGRNTLRLPARATVNLRADREISLRKRLRLDAFAQAFNLLNTRNLSHLETRAFLVGSATEPGEPTPLIFQDAPTIAAEGLTTPAFGTPTSSTSGLSRERQLELGLRLDF